MKSPKTIGKALALTLLVSLSAQTFNVSASKIKTTKKSNLVKTLKDGFGTAKKSIVDYCARGSLYGKAKAIAMTTGTVYGMSKLFSAAVNHKWKILLGLSATGLAGIGYKYRDKLRSKLASAKYRIKRYFYPVKTTLKADEDSDYIKVYLESNIKEKPKKMKEIIEL